MQNKNILYEKNLSKHFSWWITVSEMKLYTVMVIYNSDKCPSWYLTLSLKIQGHHLTNDINERWQIRSFILLLYVCNNRCLSFGPFFLLTIVFFVLRFTDSDYPFGILKLFYLKIPKGSLTEIKFLFWYLSLYVTCWAVGT